MVACFHPHNNVMVRWLLVIKIHLGLCRMRETPKLLAVFNIAIHLTYIRVA